MAVGGKRGREPVARGQLWGGGDRPKRTWRQTHIWGSLDTSTHAALCQIERKTTGGQSEGSRGDYQEPAGRQ